VLASSPGGRIKVVSERFVQEAKRAICSVDNEAVDQLIEVIHSYFK
jgi:hypothetical protein